MTSIDIGQGESRPRFMWVLFDRDNGNPGSHRYLWWFRSRASAQEHKRRQNSRPECAKLAGPFRYEVCP
jgi:hypothetical protein